MMMSYILPILLLLSILGPAASVCVPRNTNPIPYLYATPPAESPQSPAPESPAPESPQSPAPESSPPPPAKSAPVPTSADAPEASALASIVNAVTNVLGNADVTDALKGVCAYTDYPDLCVSSIQSFASSLDNVNVESVASLQIKALAAKVSDAIESARKIASESDKDTGDCLRECMENYDDGMDNIEAAKNALLSKDSGTVMSMLSAAFDSFSCSDSFSMDGSRCKGPSPTKDHDEVLTKLTSNSLAICEHLSY